MSTVELKLRRSAPWLLGALATALLIAFLAWLRHGNTFTWLVDFEIYRQGATAVLDGRELYLEKNPFSQMFFTYPPFAAVLFIPATLGALATTGFIWVVLDAAALVGVVWLLLGVVRVHDPRLRAGLTVVIAVSAGFLVPLDLELALGQLNLMLMFIVLVDLLRGGGKRWQGLGIGFVAAIKLIPLIFVVYLAVTGRVRAAVTALGVFVTCVALAFVVVPGDSMDYWFGPGLAANRPGPPQAPFNWSIRGIVARLFGTDAELHLVWVGIAMVVGIVGLLAAVVLHRKGFALRGVLVVALTALLVSPVTWPPHWVWVVPVVILLGGIAWQERSVWWLALTITTIAVAGSRVVTWIVPLEAFYPASSPANLEMSLAAQLACATYPALALLLIVALAWRPVFAAGRAAPPARRRPAAPAGSRHPGV